jgi:hypothetical protein
MVIGTSSHVPWFLSLVAPVLVELSLDSHTPQMWFVINYVSGRVRDQGFRACGCDGDEAEGYAEVGPVQ